MIVFIGVTLGILHLDTWQARILINGKKKYTAIFFCVQPLKRIRCEVYKANIGYSIQRTDPIASPIYTVKHHNAMTLE